MTQIKNSLNNLPAPYIVQFADYFFVFILQTIATTNAYLQKSINFTVTQVILFLHSHTHTINLKQTHTSNWNKQNIYTLIQSLKQLSPKKSLSVKRNSPSTIKTHTKQNQSSYINRNNQQQNAVKSLLTTWRKSMARLKWRKTNRSSKTKIYNSKTEH